MSAADVSPSEDLMMEVLAARYRLGEQVWTFANSTKPTARKLENRGWITVYSGQVERTYRAGLSIEGIKAWQLDRPYTPPARKLHALASGRSAPLGALGQRSCHDHPEVGAAYACARCRTGHRDRCILLVAW
jgi:hypothetical protein